MQNSIQIESVGQMNKIATARRNSRHIGTEKTFWELRLERLKKRLEAEQEYFLQRQQLEDIGERLAERRAAYTGEEVNPQKPVTGVPASLLLALLNG